MTDKASIYLFYGEDTYSANQRLTYWKIEFIKKFGDINVTTLEGTKIKAGDFREAYESTGFLADKRMLIVEDFLGKGKDTELQKVTQIVENPIPDCIVIFIEHERPDQRTTLFKKIKKIGKVEEFNYMTSVKLIPWITQKIKEKKGTITPVNATHLLDMVGPDMWILSQEIEKLILFADGQPIEKTHIDTMVKPNLVTSIFKLTDHIGQKNVKRSLETFQILIDSGEELPKVFHMMVRHFRILIQVLDLVLKGYTRNDINSKIKEHPYVIMTAIEQSKNFSINQLKKIYDALLSIEIAFKTGKIRMTTDDPKEYILALEKFIVNACRSSNMI